MTQFQNTVLHASFNPAPMDLSGQGPNLTTNSVIVNLSGSRTIANTPVQWILNVNLHRGP